MVEASSHFNDFLIMKSSNLLWQLLIFIIPMAKLSVVSSTICEDLAIVTKCNRMVATTSNLRNVDSLCNVGYLLMINEHGLFLLRCLLILVS